jgi:hypothetical protein
MKLTVGKKYVVLVKGSACEGKCTSAENKEEGGQVFNLSNDRTQYSFSEGYLDEEFVKVFPV